MLATFAEFGSSSELLYRDYLLSHVLGAVFGGSVGDGVKELLVGDAVQAAIGSIAGGESVGTSGVGSVVFEVAGRSRGSVDGGGIRGVSGMFGCGGEDGFSGAGGVRLFRHVSTESGITETAGGVGEGTVRGDESGTVRGDEPGSVNELDEKRESVGPFGGVSMLPRGKNYARNVASRLKRKGKKEERPVSQRGSFFSRCDDVTLKDLEVSRAKRLIAENEAAELQARRFVARDDETEGLVRQMITRMELERKVGKLASTSKIGNWAKTVVGGHASTINSPALSKVPSLESVGLGSSVSSDESVRRDTRIALYNENKRLLEQNLEAQPYLLPEQVEDAYKALVGEFADVLFTPEENAKRKIADMVQDEYASFGMNFAGAKLLVDRLNEGISYETL